MQSIKRWGNVEDLFGLKKLLSCVNIKFVKFVKFDSRQMSLTILIWYAVLGDKP